jgi:hypothetical protein
VLDLARPDAQLRGRSTRLPFLAIAALVVLPVAWFVHLAGEREPLQCTAPSPGVATAIDSIMRDQRTHVEGVQSVDVPYGDTGASFDSGNVYVDDVFVGVGTWIDHGGVGPDGDLGRYGVVQPVDDLAQAVAVNRYDFAPPKANRAARFSQHCVNGS